MDPTLLAILTMIGGAILGIIFERILKVTSFFKKLYHFIRNTPINLKVSFLFNVDKKISEDKLISEIKDNFYKNNKDWKVEADYSKRSKKMIYYSSVEILSAKKYNS